MKKYETLACSPIEREKSCRDSRGVRVQGLILVTPISSVEVPMELVSVLPDDDSFNKRAI